MLGVPFHPPAAARACHDKFIWRGSSTRRRDCGCRGSSAQRWRTIRRTLAARAPYPCVLKPLGLSASRGVIRANDAAEFVAAFRAHPGDAGERRFLQVESYIEGASSLWKGWLRRGEFEPLAIFDKPDPLEGPFFEETIYVTPSREAAAVQAALIETTGAAAAALGLRHGPVHAELRYNDEGAWMLEAHARPIGGLCARAIRMADGFRWRR